MKTRSESRAGPWLAPLVSSAVLAVVVVALVLLAQRAPIIRDFQQWGYDFLAIHDRYAAANDQIVIVDFDDDAIAAYKAFPVPRKHVAEAVRKVASGGAELIDLDFLLTEPRSPEEDKDLAAALGEAGNVIIAAQMPMVQLPATEPLPIFCDPDPADPNYCKPGGAFGKAYINIPVDEDGFARRMFLLPTRENPVYPIATSLATNFRQQGLKRSESGEVVFDGKVIPRERAFHSFRIGTWRVKPAKTVPALAVLAPGFDAAVFKGKLVIIGSSSAAGKDVHITPLFRVEEGGERKRTSGPNIVAAAVTTLLTGKAVRPMDPMALWLLNLGIAFAALLTLVRVRPGVSVISLLVAAVAMYALAQYLYSAQHFYWNYVSGGMVLLAALPAGFAYRFVEERWLKGRAEAERKQLMGIFSRYVSPEVAEEIWKRRGEIVLAGEDRTATVLFSDIRSFTQLTAEKPSAEVLAWLNEYFTAMAELISADGGFLNKFIGDGIMAVYGVPLSHGPVEDACAAVRTALRMGERVAELCEKHKGEPMYPFKIGVGIHTGPMTAGNVGSKDRMEYSVIGETVNLSSRLESLTKDFHCDIVLSPDTWELV